VELGLGLLGVIAGGAGSVLLFWLAGGFKRVECEQTERKADCLFAVTALVITLLFWAIAMMRNGIFSPGQRLAFGWLIGGIAGTVSILLSGRLNAALQDAPIRLKRLASLSCAFWGLFAVSLSYILFYSDPFYALMGTAIGAAMAAILHMGMRSSATTARVDIWALFTITLAAAIIFSVRHFDEIQFRDWWSVPILVATTVLLASYVATELSSIMAPNEKTGRSYLLNLFIAAIFIAGLAAVYSLKIVHSWQLFIVVVIGLGVAGLIAWLAAFVQNAETKKQATAVCAVLVVAFVTAAFKVWAGLGIAIGLIAVWSVMLPAAAESDAKDGTFRQIRNMLAMSLCLGLAILFFRLFIGLHAFDLRHTGLHIHYMFISAILGALLPFVLPQKTVSALDLRSGYFHNLLWGLIIVIIPLAMFVFWQLKAVLGLSLGLILAIVFVAIMYRSDQDDSLRVGFFALGSQLVASQFLISYGDMEMSRALRIYWLAGLLVAVSLWLLISGLRSGLSTGTEE
jgi:hypothetical protein